MKLHRWPKNFRDVMLGVEKSCISVTCFWICFSVLEHKLRNHFESGVGGGGGMTRLIRNTSQSMDEKKLHREGTYGRTLRLLDRIGPVGRFGEKNHRSILRF